MRLSALILYVTLCISVGHSYGLSFTCRLGSELAKALADPSVSVADIEADIVLQDSDFSGFNLPIMVGRDLKIQGISGQQQRLLDFNYVANKVQLVNGVNLTFYNLTVAHPRAKSFSLAPGVDLLMSTLPGVKAAVVFDNGAHVLELCYPNSVQLYVARPEEIPGKQVMLRKLPQPGCINSSTAPLLERCWAMKSRWEDFALYAYDVAYEAAAAGTTAVEQQDLVKAFRESQTYTNYNVWFKNHLSLCVLELSDDCVMSLGILGCVWQAAAELPPAKPMIPSVAIPGGAAHSNSSSVNYPPGSVEAVREGPPSQEEEHDKSVVLPAVVGAVGGTVVLAAVSAVVALLMMRQRRRRQQSEGTAAEMSWSSKCPTGGGCEAGKGLQLTSDDDLEATSKGGMEQQPAVRRADAIASRYAVLSPLTPLRRDVNLHARLITFPSDNAAQKPALQHEVQHSGSQNTDSNLPSDERGDMAAGRSVCSGDHGASAVQQPSRNPSSSTQEELRLLDIVLGRGGSGKVLVGEYRGKMVAVKVLQLTGTLHEDDSYAPAKVGQAEVKRASDTKDAQLSSETSTKCKRWDQAGEDRLSELTIQAFLQEVEILGRCQHPNIVRLLAACTAPPRLCLVMELAETNLVKLLYEHGNFAVQRGSTSPNMLPLPVVLNIAIDIARGLEYLHPTIMHRDLKPANVLIFGANTERPVAKLADFGLSRLRSTVQATANPEVGTPPYMAPECFDVFNFIVTHHVDIYSWAVLMYEMLSGQTPWCGMSMSEIAFNVALKGRRPPLGKVPPERCPRKLSKLIVQCWDQVPMRRPAAAEVVKQLLLIRQGLSAAQRMLS